MKKGLIVCLAIALTLGLAFSVQAKNTVQVTLTSPTITKTGCEKVGSVTFSFDDGSEINVGDWWYMDLPQEVSICTTTINYLIMGGGGGNIIFDPANAGNALFTSGNQSVILDDNAANGNGNMTYFGGTANDSFGLLYVSKQDSTAGNASVITRTGGNMAIRVYGPIGDRRVTLTPIADTWATKLSVSTGYRMMIKILDGNAWNNTGNVIADGNQGAAIRLDTGGVTNIYGDSTADWIDTATYPEPSPQNTLCVNATNMAGSYMYVSFASLNDKFTFTGDSQIAHTGSAASIALANCKGVTTGNVKIGGQAGCNFTYENATNYCAADAFKTQTTDWATTGGNKFIIQSATVFGDAGDTFRIYAYIDTPGVYFTGNLAQPFGGTSAQNMCTAGPGLVGTGLTTPAAAAVAWTGYIGNTATATFATTNCTVAASNRVAEQRTSQIGNLNLYNKIEIQIGSLAYDTSLATNGTNVIFRADLRKYPCGTIFSGTRTIATLVTTCPAGAGSSALLFPWLPAPSPTDASLAVWWGGLVVVNGSDTSGTAALTVYEMDGDMGTYTTPSIAGHGMWQTVASVLIPMLTAGATNTGTLGDSNFSVAAACNFNAAAGFAFTGNTNEGTGYPAYTDKTGWMD